MPIRFRCVYCDQLLGIARRKSGTVVKCPNCSGQLMVPSPEPDDDDVGPDAPTASTEDVGGARRAAAAEKTAPAPALEKQTAAANAGMLFERNDFDELLKPAIERKPAVAGKTGPAVRCGACRPPRRCLRRPSRPRPRSTSLSRRLQPARRDRAETGAVGPGADAAKAGAAGAAGAVWIGPGLRRRIAARLVPGQVTTWIVRRAVRRRAATLRVPCIR